MPIQVKPILMNAFSINAILKSKKLQTRRVIRPQPSMFFTTFSKLEIFKSVLHALYKDGTMVKCPYGNVGDRLWVRETWAAERGYNHVAPRHLPSRYASTKNIDLWWRADRASCRRLNAKPGKWRPSIFMPRWASRITLKITGVRVERVQDISEIDAQLEGWDLSNHPLDQRYDPVTMDTARRWFADLWDSINLSRGYGWDLNPWVWRVEFKLLKGATDGKHNNRVV